MRINVMSIMVDDQAKALCFYTEVLGFVRKREIPLGEHSWLTVVSPDQLEGTELSLEPDEHPAARPFKQALVEDGIPFTSFAVDDVAGADIIQHVMTDGFTATWSGSIPQGAGFWTTSTLPPAGVMLGDVTPYFIESNEQFRPAPRPAYLSPEFNADLAAVLAIRTNLTPQQNAIALKWRYGGGTYTPLGFWNELASTYVAAAGLDEAAAARVFGLMGASVFDAMITTLSAKYFYWTLRPHQANPAVTTSFAVPNYPAYPSGHGSVSAASARVLAHFFPNRGAELDALVQEAAISRVYAGIHYFFDMTAARSSAEAVADWVLQSAP